MYSRHWARLLAESLERRIPLLSVAVKYLLHHEKNDSNDHNDVEKHATGSISGLGILPHKLSRLGADETYTGLILGTRCLLYNVELKSNFPQQQLQPFQVGLSRPQSRRDLLLHPCRPPLLRRRCNRTCVRPATSERQTIRGRALWC